MISLVKGKADFIFLYNPQKSSVNAFLMRKIKKHGHKKAIVRFHDLGKEKSFKSSSFCNISNIHNAIVALFEIHQTSLFERIARFL